MEDHGYKLIVLKGRFSGSNIGYTQAQCDMARRDGAPMDAIYKLHAGRWFTSEQLINGALRTFLELPALPENHPTMLAYYERAVKHAQAELSRWQAKLTAAQKLNLPDD